MKKNLNINKTALTVIILNFIQVLSIIGVLIYSFFIDEELITNKNFFQYSIYILILLTAFINSFITVKDSLIILNYNSQFETIKGNLTQVENLNKTLRGQRHDFMNHLQVIYSLMEINEYADAQDYIHRVYSDIQKVNNILKTSKPAINALLQAKLLACEHRGIRMELNISSSLKDMTIPVWELCRIIGNLIDNAIYALSNVESEKAIIVNLYEDISSYGIRISNNGPAITHEISDKIFEAGFTTKGNKGDGMGLSIVRDIAAEYNGNVKFSSTTKITYFEITFPKQILRQGS